jgi:hypothetical protein
MNLLHTFLIQTDYFPHEDKTHIKTSNNHVLYIHTNYSGSRLM